MALWNAILPEVVDAKPLSYWQALGLLLLSRILFGGFRFGGGGAPWGRKRRGRWANLERRRTGADERSLAAALQPFVTLSTQFPR